MDARCWVEEEGEGLEELDDENVRRAVCAGGESCGTYTSCPLSDFSSPFFFHPSLRVADGAVVSATAARRKRATLLRIEQFGSD